MRFFPDFFLFQIERESWLGMFYALWVPMGLDMESSIPQYNLVIAWIMVTTDQTHLPIVPHLHKIVTSSLLIHRIKSIAGAVRVRPENIYANNNTTIRRNKQQTTRQQCIVQVCAVHLNSLYRV